MKTRARKRSNKTTSFERKRRYYKAWLKEATAWEDYLYEELINTPQVLWDPYTSYYTN